MEFQVRRPYYDKHVMVTFTSKTKRESYAANIAVEAVLRVNGLQPFHQVGCSFDGANNPGFHGWEIWVDGQNVERVTALIPKIQELYIKEWEEHSWVEEE